MLTTVKLYAGHQQYYKDAVARGRDEYYTGAGELPGTWMGRGAARLGLSGELDGDALDAIFDGRNPRTDARLSAKTPKIVAYDATFNAPKSVSLLYVLGTPEVAAQVKAAHEAAIDAALRAYEEITCRVRRSHGGTLVIEADGFLGAGYQHRSSRAGDPHLHTHVLISHAAPLDEDGRWTALDGRLLFPWAKPCGHLYEAKLRLELTQRLGVTWGPVRKGIADIAEVPRSVIVAFSQRRQEIEAHLEEHGRSSTRSAQLATYATRKPKDRDTSSDDLFAEWRTRAEDLGISTETVAGWTGIGRDVPPPTDAEVGELFSRLAGPTGLTERASTFERRSLVQAVADSFEGGGEVDDVLELVDRFLASSDAIALPVLPRSGVTVRTRDGKLQPLETDRQRFTTPELLAVERHALAHAVGRRGENTAVASAMHLRNALSMSRHLSDEQRAMVVGITTSGHGVVVVVGVAGSGKTAALNAAREAWERHGYRVLGCALAARAANELQNSAGVPSSTIDRLLGSAERAEGRLDADVLIIDEAGMVGTRMLARVLDLCEANNVKAVLVGDHRQLPEINAGGAFAALADELGAVTLRTNRRQVHRWERDALAALRDGDPEAAIDVYLTAGRVRVGETAPEIYDHMVTDWWASRTRGDDVLMLAGRRAQVDALNRRARDQLRDTGELGGEEVVVGGRAFAVGDAVIAGRNDYRLGLLNSTRGTVIDVDCSKSRLTVQTAEGAIVDVPRRYLAAGHLTHGYATTIHKAQGATIDESLLLIDDQSYREAAYTGLSRGRAANRVYVVTDDTHAIEAHGVRPEPPDELATLREAIGRSAAQQLASRPTKGRVLGL